MELLDNKENSSHYPSFFQLRLKERLPYIATAPPSNSPPVFPSSPCCPGCFAPTERAPSANATSPAPHEPAGSQGVGGKGGIWQEEVVRGRQSWC